MSNLKSMFERMNKTGCGDSPEKMPLQPAKQKQTIEKVYQKKSQLEHILLRPDTYIGSVEHITELMWVYDQETKAMVQKNITYVPGLYKIYDEILVNAADNKQRDPTMDCIKVEINPAENTISVWNNGKGIPVVMHKEEKMYVPTMIFGHLLTSSNYNDDEAKVTGGRNGYGAKLCNIFSTKFVLETGSKDDKRHFKQTWASNMSKASEPKIRDGGRIDDFTKVTFNPDLVKFKMDRLDEDIVALMSRRAFDIAASTRGIKVFLNGERLPIRNFKDYMNLYIKSATNEDDNNAPIKVCYDNPHERWEIGMCISNRGFQQVSFVNSIATTKGGRHVDYIADMIVKQVTEIIKKKNKTGAAVKPFQIKNHLWIFLNCLVVNPTFDSQTKENMTLQAKNFGSKCSLSEDFVKNVVKSGVIESVLTWAKFKAQTQLEKSSGKKMTKLKGIPKLEDANEAGSRNALKCTLILTEGDSAKSLAVSGLGVIGRDHYGVFPLRGKLLNVREATHKQILENAEINNLIKILGLQYKKKYTTEEDMKTLRYGKVMIMTDQDQDGSHIKGLLINFIHYNWPDLIKQDFLEEFITPIVKATKRNEELSFYSLPEFEEWKSNTANYHTYNIKYYKGLGTSTSKEAKEYFTNMARHRIRFRYAGQSDDDNILLAFSKKHVEQRKVWLTNFMEETKRRKELGLPEQYLYGKDTKFVSYSDFVNLELVLFSNADNVRSIPSMVDGLKPGQRKVLFTCIKRNDKKEVKVAQLAGSVAEQSAYHHGEVSLCMTIVNLAQNYVGSNNINLLEPRGQFGTRLSGGKDSASPRYIFTKMSPLTRLIFHPNDDPLLKHEYDDNKKIEPVWYMPIIPMVLVNGADGIGTGWMTKIPNYNPREIVTNIRAMMEGSELMPMMPWYKNFRGTIEDGGDHRYVVSGEIAIIGNEKLEITELPVGSWTQVYKENVLESLLHGSEKVKAVISDYKEYNTDTTVKFVVTLMPGQMSNVEKEGFHKVFKLQTMITTTSMCVFDELGCLRRMDNIFDIFREFYTLRLKMYTKRKDYMEGMLEAEAAKLTNQARFIMEKCSGDLVVENKKRKKIVDELIQRGYQADPVAEWKKRQSIEEEEEEETEGGGEQEEAEGAAAKKKPVDPEKAFKSLSDVKKFDYLLGMSMWMLTDEKKDELLRQKDQKVFELEVLKKKSSSDLWREDLDAFSEKLDELEEKERREEAGVPVKKEKKLLGMKKKPSHNESLPTENATRIKPEITEDLKKKIQTAAKIREKKVMKKENSQENEDEFDAMSKPGKTIKEKLGGPNDGEKKKRGRKPKDGMKQTTLDFSKKELKKKSKSESDSDSEPKKKPEGKAVMELSSEDEDIFYDNKAALEKSIRQAVMSDSEGSSDMFEAEMRKPASKRKRGGTKESDFSSEGGAKKTSKKKKKIASDSKKTIGKKKVVDSDSDSDSDGGVKKTSAKKKVIDSVSNVGVKKTNTKKKVIDSDSDSDSDGCVKKTNTKKKVVGSKKAIDLGSETDENFTVDSDSDSEVENKPPPPLRGPVGRRGKPFKKYVFGDSDEST